MSIISREYYRNGPPHRAGADVSFQDIRSIFGFYSIRIGRWVTAAEQQHAANLFFDALCDLQDILQVPSPVISCRGALALHFGIGGRPGASAHYLSNGRVLALAKNAGGGSLAHEWFHAFDHYIATKLFETPPPTSMFASRQWLKRAPLNGHPLNQILHLTYRRLFLADDGREPSDFFKHCAAYDIAQGTHYFSQPEEMAARAFECVIQRQSLKNHFLVAGTLQSATAKAGLYPNAELAGDLSTLFLSYFERLGKAVEQDKKKGA